MGFAYGERFCGDCEHLKRSRPWRGEVQVRCMNPDNGRHCGWTLCHELEEVSGEVSILTPVWCRKEATK